MAIDKKLIHFKTWNKFIEQIGGEANITTPTSGKEEDGTALYGQIKGTSIVFIKDVGKIWTHGNLYKGVNWSTIPNLIVFTIDNVRCDAEDGMTWYEWCNSEYNTLGIICAGNSYYVYHSDGKRMVLTGLDEGVMGSNQIEKLDYRIGYGSGGGN